MTHHTVDVGPWHVDADLKVRSLLGIAAARAPCGLVGGGVWPDDSYNSSWFRCLSSPDLLQLLLEESNRLPGEASSSVADVGGSANDGTASTGGSVSSPLPPQVGPGGVWKVLLELGVVVILCRWVGSNCGLNQDVGMDQVVGSTLPPPPPLRLSLVPFFPLFLVVFVNAKFDFFLFPSFLFAASFSRWWRPTGTLTWKWSWEATRAADRCC